MTKVSLAARVLLALVVAAGASSSVAQTALDSDYGTGLVQADPQAYAALPAVQRFRNFLPPSINLTERFPTPGHQHQQGSCASWAVAYAARSFLVSKELGRPIAGPDEIPSPAYIYNSLGTDPTCRKGSTIADALNLLKREGALGLSAFPYVADRCVALPPPELRPMAARFRLADFRVVERKRSAKATSQFDWRDPVIIDDIKGALARGRAVVFGMKLPADFGHKLDGFKGVFRSDERYDRWGGVAAGHAMALVGYDDDRQAFRLINSWGTGWGDGGYLWIDYDTFQDLTGEAYVLEPQSVAAEPPKARPAPSLPVDQRLRAALGTPACGRLTVTEQGGRRVVTGFAGDSAEIATLRAQALAIDPDVDWSVRHRPFPQCEAEVSLERALREGGARLLIARENGPDMPDGDVRLAEDEIFTIEVETSSARPFVHVVYIDNEGAATELYRGAPPAGDGGRRRIKVGAAGTKEVRFQVGPPFGPEVIIAVASDRDLFGPALSDYATERQFLSSLRTALVKARESGRPVSAAVRHLQTSAKS
jgi:hypothetical protein